MNVSKSECSITALLKSLGFEDADGPLYQFKTFGTVVKLDLRHTKPELPCVLNGIIAATYVAGLNTGKIVNQKQIEQALDIFGVG